MQPRDPEYLNLSGQNNSEKGQVMEKPINKNEQYNTRLMHHKALDYWRERFYGPDIDNMTFKDFLNLYKELYLDIKDLLEDGLLRKNNLDIIDDFKSCTDFLEIKMYEKIDSSIRDSAYVENSNSENDNKETIEVDIKPGYTINGINGLLDMNHSILNNKDMKIQERIHIYGKFDNFMKKKILTFEEWNSVFSCLNIKKSTNNNKGHNDKIITKKPNEIE